MVHFQKQEKSDLKPQKLKLYKRVDLFQGFTIGNYIENVLLFLLRDADETIIEYS